MPQNIVLVIASFAIAGIDHVNGAFNIPSIDTFFKPNVVSPPKETISQLLETVSNTENGQKASVDTQRRALSIARDLEMSCPPSNGIFSNPEESKVLDGVWYLQYTSPSELENVEEIPNSWKPIVPDDGGVETQKFDARGTISVSGIPIPTSKRDTKQIFYMKNRRFVNEVNLPLVKVSVGGSFRSSQEVPTRTLVTFDEGQIELSNGACFKLDFLFTIRRFLASNDFDGWLEITYIDEDIRISRGNKGSLFVLTRDPTAVLV